MGAGVQGFEINKAAFDKGLQVVTGSCPTVGVAGGYSQGGGHSALTSAHGMAADQVRPRNTLSLQIKLTSKGSRMGSSDC